jgi:hypothetical protein
MELLAFGRKWGGRAMIGSYLNSLCSQSHHLDADFQAVKISGLPLSLTAQGNLRFGPGSSESKHNEYDAVLDFVCVRWVIHAKQAAFVGKFESRKLTESS